MGILLLIAAIVAALILVVCGVWVGIVLIVETFAAGPIAARRHTTQRSK